MTTWAFDIETTEWDVFVLGAAVADDGRVQTFDTPDQVRAWYLDTEPGDVVLAHNGGRFDFLFLIDAVGEGTWRGAIAGAALISAQCEGHAECRDTARLFPMSLAAWTGEKEEWNHDWTSLDMPMSGPRGRKALLDYCVQDCRALLRAYLRDIHRADSIGVSIRDKKGRPRLTIGSAAFATAAEICGIDRQRPLTWSEYRSARSGYYGGRCEVFRVAADGGHQYDINSAYPWALTREVPTGKPRHVWGSGAMGELARQTPGLYEAIVHVPESPFPLLPHRHGPSLIWATGTIRGTWTHIELDAAVRHGAEIERVRAAYIYPTEEPIYRPYMRHFYRERQKAKDEGDTAWAAWLKLLLNSLSGKLAQQPEACSLHIRPDPNKIPTSGDKALSWRWIGGDVYAAPERRIAKSARPAQAAVLTSRARVLLLDRLVRVGDGALYCDTDSVYCYERDDMDVDPTRLGAWKYEGDMPLWRGVAPKIYTDGTRAKAKGIPKPTPADVAILAMGGLVKKRVGVAGVRSAFGRHGRAFVANEVARQLRSDPRVAGTRWVAENGATQPLARREDGTYHWPGRHVAPAEILPRLRRKA